MWLTHTITFSLLSSFQIFFSFCFSEIHSTQLPRSYWEAKHHCPVSHYIGGFSLFLFQQFTFFKKAMLHFLRFVLFSHIGWIYPVTHNFSLWFTWLLLMVPWSLQGSLPLSGLWAAFIDMGRMGLRKESSLEDTCDDLLRRHPYTLLIPFTVVR